MTIFFVFIVDQSLRTKIKKTRDRYTHYSDLIYDKTVLEN